MGATGGLEHSSDMIDLQVNASSREGQTEFSSVQLKRNHLTWAIAGNGAIVARHTAHSRGQSTLCVAWF